MRDALTAYLAQPTASTWTLGDGVLGLYSGLEDLAETPKNQLADVWADKHAQRSTFCSGCSAVRFSSMRPPTGA